MKKNEVAKAVEKQVEPVSPEMLQQIKEAQHVRDVAMISDVFMRILAGRDLNTAMNCACTVIYTVAGAVSSEHRQMIANQLDTLKANVLLIETEPQKEH